MSRPRGTSRIISWTEREVPPSYVYVKNERDLPHQFMHRARGTSHISLCTEREVPCSHVSEVYVQNGGIRLISFCTEREVPRSLGMGLLLGLGLRRRRQKILAKFLSRWCWEYLSSGEAFCQRSREGQRKVSDLAQFYTKSLKGTPRYSSTLEYRV